jgi:hypothetical protein
MPPRTPGHVASSNVSPVRWSSVRFGMTASDRDGHISPATPLKQDPADLLPSAARMLAVVFVVWMFLAWMAEGFVPRAGVLPVEEDDAMRSEP